MNKVILFLLVVCLVSVHAYVKRDAPATDAQVKDFFSEAGKKIEDGWKEFTGKVNPEFIQKTFGDAINKAFAEFKPSEAPKA